MERRSVAVDPLQLGQMPIEDADDLRQLPVELAQSFLLIVKHKGERGKGDIERKHTGSSGLLPLLRVLDMSLISLIILVRSLPMSSSLSVNFSASLYVR